MLDAEGYFKLRIANETSAGEDFLQHLGEMKKLLETYMREREREREGEGEVEREREILCVWFNQLAMGLFLGIYN